MQLYIDIQSATGEFEVTDERLGVYRPEEHIDNPKDYADNVDARQFDQRLRPPVSPEELAIDPNTGMKNYIANENGGWATSVGYIKYSFARSIHFGRVYTHGSNKGREEDLCEALRCLGQGLHCLEDFGAHTNYTELALRELGFHNVFPHVGTATQINLRGRQVYPLVTGTFGGVDFLHSVLGEATDHVTQSEVEEMNDALGSASANKPSSGDPSREASGLTDLLSRVPGTGNLCQEAISLQADSDAQAANNAGMAGSQGGQDQYGSVYEASRASNTSTPFAAPPGSQGGPPGPGVPGMNPNLDPQAVIAKIYPILVFRDKVVRTINNVISKIPGLEKLIETITERLTLFVMSLLAPYIRPIIAAASQQLKTGSSAVIDSSGKHQYEVWQDPYCSDPTHSLLSKDHFSNILNEPAGQVASTILQYVAPRIIYAWDKPNVPAHEVLDDVSRVLHHPAIRDQDLEIHRNMFAAVEKWLRSWRGADLNEILSSESVKAGRNQGQDGHGHGGSTQSMTGGPLGMFGQKKDDLPVSNTQSPYATYHSPPPGQQHQQPPAFDPTYSQPPVQPAGFAQNDPYAYPTAYQQGYEVPYGQEAQPYHGQTSEQQYGQQQSYTAYNPGQSGNQENQAYGQQGEYGQRHQY